MKNKVSRLYHLQPIGLGSPLVESLTGYIAQLAKAHCIYTGTLIREEIAPLLGKDYLTRSSEKGGNRFYDNSRTFNGMGQTSEDLVSALQTLTYVNDLQYLTLLPLRNIISPRELMNPLRRWCPQCLEEWKEKGKTIYEPLIWNIKCVDACSEHHIKLTDTCPECFCTNSLINRSTIPGYCSKCGSWLGRNTSAITRTDLSDWQSWVNENVRSLLPFIYQNRDLNLQNIYSNIKLIVGHFSNGNIGGFSRSVQIPKSSLWSWYYEKNAPGLESLMKISFSTQIPLTDLLTEIKALPEKKQLKQNFNLAKRKSSREFPEEIIRDILEKMAAGQNILSMSEAARQIGWDKRILYRHFPFLCKQIADLHSEAIKKKQEEDAFNCFNTVKETAELLISRGTYPSRRQIESVISPQISLRGAMAKQAWHEVINNLALKEL